MQNFELLGLSFTSDLGFGTISEQTDSQGASAPNTRVSNSVLSATAAQNIMIPLFREEGWRFTPQHMGAMGWWSQG